MERLTIRLLGPVHLDVDDQHIPVKRPKVRALLANLALNVGRTVSTDRLRDGLWNGDAPRDPHHALQMHMSRLRRVHPCLEHAVRTEPGGYRLSVEPRCIDAVRFERIASAAHRRVDTNPQMAATALDGALTLWHGDALGDLHYDEFAAGPVRRLDELRLRAIEDRCQVAIMLDEAEAVVGDLEQLTFDHPMRDRPIELLLRALLATGQPTAARFAYRCYVERLWNEFGLRPSPTLRRLIAGHELLV